MFADGWGTWGRHEGSCSGAALRAFGSRARSVGDSGPAAAQPAAVEGQSGFVWTVPPTWSPAWVLRFVFCLSPFSRSAFLHFLSLSVFVYLPRRTALVFNGDRENICLFS